MDKREIEQMDAFVDDLRLTNLNKIYGGPYGTGLHPEVHARAIVDYLLLSPDAFRQRAELAKILEACLLRTVRDKKEVFAMDDTGQWGCMPKDFVGDRRNV